MVEGPVDLLQPPWSCTTTEQWDNKLTLSGKSKVIVDDPYVLTVHLPDGYRLKSAEVGSEKVKVANQKETATVRIVPSATKTVDWKMTFTK